MGICLSLLAVMRLKVEKVSPDMKLTAKTFTYDVNGCCHPKPREIQEVSIMGDSH